MKWAILGVSIVCCEIERRQDGELQENPQPPPYLFFGNYILFDPIGILSATRAAKNKIKPQKPKKTVGFYLCIL